jgi:hypothetical protein
VTNRQSAQQEKGFLLTDRDIINPRVSGSDYLSGENSPDIEEERFQVFIGKRPVIRDLREIARKAKKKLPEKLQGLEGNKLLLVETTVGVWQEKGLRKVTQVGFEVSYPSKPYITVRDILPQSQYVKRVGGTFSCSAGVNVNGKFCNPAEEVVRGILESIIPDIKLPNIPTLPKIEIQLSGKGEVFGNFSFHVGTKTIDAIGEDDDHCIWKLKKADEPLTGKPHHFIQVLLVPERLSKLKFKCRVSVVTSMLRTFERTYRSNWRWISSEIRHASLDTESGKRA